uniref:Uncharacterized protein n=1 Tax=Brassica oleracea TaxID=3712 RepID=A0A3P6FW55_BRAOL|nr:unnamed protein product [Brassica oleracea]
MDQVTGISRWIAMEQVTESVMREIAKSIASVQALTWEVIGSRTWESAGVRNRENEMESNRVSDRDIEMKSVTEKSRYRHEATQVFPRIHSLPLTS